MAAEAFAPAKINLTLHVTGQRADQYHLLDSLVVFAGVGDRITAEDAPDLSLTIDGPMAVGLGAGDDNLVLRAARFLSGRGAALRLEKNLPLSSGIGGGSSDAAATLRALAALWALALPDEGATAKLGADVPVCLAARSRRMAGIGDVLTSVPPLPQVWLVMANPGVHVPTPQVFRALARKVNPPMPVRIPRFATASALADFLRPLRNDLQAPAISLAPVIGDVLATLEQTDHCLLARMSGSGATCFGLYETAAQAQLARDKVSTAHPGWWVAAAPILP